MGPVQIVIAVLVVGYILHRRFVGSVLEARRLLVLPLILAAVGVAGLGDLHALSASGVALLVAGTAVSVVLGLVRGATVRVADRDGVVWMRYRGVTVALWVLTIAVKIGLAVVAHGADASSGAVLSLGLGIVAESVVILLRALRLESSVLWRASGRRTGRPVVFAPAVPKSDRW